MMSEWVLDRPEEITIPTLVIHGRNDVLIPASDGQELHRRSAAADKRLLLIPGAGHNDLLWAVSSNTEKAQRPTEKNLKTLCAPL